MLPHDKERSWLTGVKLREVNRLFEQPKVRKELNPVRFNEEIWFHPQFNLLRLVNPKPVTVNEVIWFCSQIIVTKDVRPVKLSEVIRLLKQISDSKLV